MISSVVTLSEDKNIIKTEHKIDSLKSDVDMVNVDSNTQKIDDTSKTNTGAEQPQDKGFTILHPIRNKKVYVGASSMENLIEKGKYILNLPK